MMSFGISMEDNLIHLLESFKNPHWDLIFWTPTNVVMMYEVFEFEYILFGPLGSLLSKLDIEQFVLLALLGRYLTNYGSQSFSEELLQVHCTI